MYTKHIKMKLFKLLLIILICVLNIKQIISFRLLSERKSSPLYLTNYIDVGDLIMARELSKVHLFAPRRINSYSGFFTVNKTYESNIFHWYFVSEQYPKTAPVILWLNGGLSTTSMLGVFEENGPFIVNNRLGIDRREFAWARNHHVIYMDNPIGVGYSYTKDDRGYSRNTTEVVENIYAALQQFYKLFPRLKNNDLYLMGESYSAKYIPALAALILSEDKIPKVQGIALGNGFIHPAGQISGIGKYLYYQGFLDDYGLEKFEQQEKKCVKAIEEKMNLDLCYKIMDPFSNETLVGGLMGYNDLYNVLHSKRSTHAFHNREIYIDQIKDIIHVGNLPRQNKNEKVREFLGDSIFDSEKENIEKLLEDDVKILIYSGQLDIIIPYVITSNFLKSLNFTYAEEYSQAHRKIWYVDNQVAGYVKTGGPLSEAVIIGAGHMVPLDQPKRAWDLITKFTRNKL